MSHRNMNNFLVCRSLTFVVMYIDICKSIPENSVLLGFKILFGNNRHHTLVTISAKNDVR
jgi:hypothetical protein